MAALTEPVTTFEATTPIRSDIAMRRVTFPVLWGCLRLKTHRSPFNA